MNLGLKRLWDRRSEIKNQKLDRGVPSQSESLSGMRLNQAAGLPVDAMWKESNFS